MSHGHAIKVALSDTFLDAMMDLPKAPRKATIKFVQKFRANPTSPGLNYETINNASDANMRSVRVDQSYRAIVLKPTQGNVYVLLWVANHDDAYDWATRKRVTIHPGTGSVQILSAELEQGLAEASAAAETGRPPLFDQFRDRELKRFGLPDQLLPLVRSVSTVDEFEALQDAIPAEAFEALYWLAEGESIEDVYRALMMTPVIEENEKVEEFDTEDFGAALDRAGSKRHFWVVEDEMELAAILEEPLERWRVYLHPVQRRLVERDWNGPVRVLGGAGTGKTVVAMHRANYLAQRICDGPDDRILLTTYTRNLAADIQANLRELCTPEVLRRIEVVNLDRWVSDFLNRQGYPHDIRYFGSDQRLEKLWAEALTYRSDDLDLPESFYREEWEYVVQDRAVETLRDYFVADRAGRGVALHRATRKTVWRVFEEYRALLAREGLREAPDAMRDARRILANKGGTLPYQAVIVDEAQDMGSEAFRLIRQLVPFERPNDIFLVGDAHQRIYRHKVVLGRCGVKVVGRSHRLRINYRTTDELRQFAVAVLKDMEVDDLDGGTDSVLGYRSLTHGEPPHRCVCTSLAEEVDSMAEFLGDEAGWRSTCVIARTQKLLDEYSAALGERGIETYRLSRDGHDDRSVPGVRLATMHRVKGLEFDRVIVAGLNDGIMPLKWAVQSPDVAVREAAEHAERSLLYVSVTRARRHAMISAHGKPSPYLGESRGMK